MVVKRNLLDLNDLPDSLLIYILSKVPLKQVVRCSVVCKRWKSLWTSLPILKILSLDFSSSSYSCLVDNIFERHSGNLELFEFSNTLSFDISDKLSNWIHSAALKHVREIKIKENTSIVPFVEVPTSIFLCHTLRSLIVNSFLLTNIPDYFVGFAGLETLNFENVKLTDNNIAFMVQLCPVLKILRLFNCYGLRSLKIFSESLVSLNLCSRIEAITASCPQLMSLTLIKYLCNMIEMDFYLPACSSLCTDAAQFRVFTTLKSLKKITLVDLIHKDDVPILCEFPDLEKICIGNLRYTALPWSNAVFPEISASSSLKNLKRVHLKMTLFYDAAPLLAYLLPRSPALKSVSVSRKKGFDGTRALRFINRVLNLQHEFPGAKILLSRDTVKEGRCLNCDLENYN
ncbi:putative FBD-associated F-box protein At5g53635 [Cryptomeria japonica]|uniref:putative FBD-associated F-box protein At5g53635 n=1 Tax=Cryptomeria japonica TaxID=3369 RepID=UPI0025AC79B2|nr:putative FBD-associated F-box protein At5g53635 [Cryptomeria japonica]XP_059065508.1 putative FBD-associated F-box protein At5g53635 [Cryptomeria japonica]